MENHHFLWINQLFQFPCPFSIARIVYQRINPHGFWIDWGASCWVRPMKVARHMATKRPRSRTATWATQAFGNPAAMENGDFTHRNCDFSCRNCWFHQHIGELKHEIGFLLIVVGASMGRKFAKWDQPIHGISSSTMGQSPEWVKAISAGKQTRNSKYA